MRDRYLVLNKPFHVLCQFTPGKLETAEASEPRRTLADFVRVPNVYPAGRLDYDSEGLVLLTSDGGWQHRVTDPNFGHRRTYLVQVEGEIGQEAMARLQTGIRIQDYRTRPCEARVVQAPEIGDRQPPIRVRKDIPTSWIEMTLVEGRNRQVRRMTAAVGFPTLRLVRMAIGSVRLGTLKPGEWRDLTQAEVRALANGIQPL